MARVSDTDVIEIVDSPTSPVITVSSDSEDDLPQKKFKEDTEEIQ